MSNGMVKMNGAVFDRLRSVSRLAGRALSGEARWIATTGEDKEILKSARRVDVQTRVPGRDWCWIKTDSHLLVVMAGTMPSLIRGAVIHTSGGLAASAGLRTYCWAEGISPVRSGNDVGLQIFDEVETLVGEMPSDKISAFFESFSVLELDDSEYDSSDADVAATRLAALFVLGLVDDNDRSAVGLPFTANFVQSAQVLFEGGVSGFLGDQLFRALTASHWRHAFLEIYQVIESCYPYPYVSRLHSRIGASGDVAAFLVNCQEMLAWKPREDLAVAEVLSVCSDPAIANLRVAMHMDGDSTLEAVARRLYAHRNAVAHSRREPQNFPDWPPFLDAVLAVTQELKRRFPL